MSRPGRLALVALVVFLLPACTTLDPSRFRTFVVDRSGDAEIEYRGVPLRSGQIVVGDAGDADTLLLSMLSESFSPFVHAGVVSIEKHQAFVYDGYVPVSMFIHGPPSNATGGIRRVTLDEYIRGQRIVAIFDPAASIDRAGVVRFAQERFRDGTPFDIYFDWRDHTRVYCTEFVALALAAGGAPLPSLDRIRPNASLNAVLEWFKVDAREIVTAQGLIQSSHRVALLSRDYSADELTAYFSAKQELHARFTDDQKLGNVWTWTWRGLGLQPNVAAFLKASHERPHEPTAQLAREFFGERAPSASPHEATQ